MRGIKRRRTDFVNDIESLNNSFSNIANIQNALETLLEVNLLNAHTILSLKTQQLTTIYILQKGLQTFMRNSEIHNGIPRVWSALARKKILAMNHPCYSQTESGTQFFELMEKITAPFYQNSTEKHDFVGPPTGSCQRCRNELTKFRDASKIRHVSVTGAVTNKRKVTFICHQCGLNYGYDQFGNKKTGYEFYNSQRDAVAPNDTTLIDRKVTDIQASFGQHSWVSFEGFAESWSTAHKYSPSEEIDRRVWAMAFWWAEIETELRERQLTFKFKSDSDLEAAMVEIDRLRQQAPYPHTDCTDECQRRGCGKLWITDGIWKLQFAHCMFVETNEVTGMPTVNLPSTCTNQPVANQAFCHYHINICKEADPPIPTGLRDFLQFANGGTVSEAVIEEEAASTMSTVLDHTYAGSFIKEHGAQQLISSHPDVVSHVEANADPAIGNCSKDLGEGQCLRLMSRGHQFVVRAGGHIDTWTPLYKSESLGQVYLFIISWLFTVVSKLPESDWGRIWLAYDFMCGLLKTKAAKEPLPLPKPFNNMFLKINKIVDALHIRNHKDNTCHTDLHPDNIFEMHPDLRGGRNTQAGEQTFVWLGRFKRIVCSMPKTHHLFYLHRMISRRNAYISKCYRLGRKPLMPGKRAKR